MWPFSRIAPQISHESCRKRVDELETRIERLEEREVELRIKSLDAMEKLARRVNQRVQKREDEEEPPEEIPNASPRYVRRLRGF